MQKDFWKDQRVLVTGHTGFKGSWLALWLQELGAQVVGLALEPPSTPSLFEVARLEDRLISIRGDVRDSDALDLVFTKHSPQFVFHLAAQSLVRRSYIEPIETYSTNVMGTAQVLEACRTSEDLKAAIIVTSDKCYENRETLRGYREDDPLGGHDPYSSSKGAAEIVTAAYRSSFFREPGSAVVSSARAGNVIGGGDWAVDRLVPDLIRGFESGEPIEIRRPGAIRPWQHVLEPLRGYLAIAENATQETDFGGQAWNFGPDTVDERPVSWVADRLVELWGDGAEWTHDQSDHPHEAGYLNLDSSKARELMGWRPVLPLEEALSWVVDWHRATSDGRDPVEVSLEQLEAYTSRCALR